MGRETLTVRAAVRQIVRLRRYHRVNPSHAQTPLQSIRVISARKTSTRVWSIPIVSPIQTTRKVHITHIHTRGMGCSPASRIRVPQACPFRARVFCRHPAAHPERYPAQTPLKRMTVKTAIHMGVEV